jgi:crossover junction endodeoxyribonuclease RuvC
MKILGIDPGLQRVGIALAEISGGTYTLLQCGVITTEPGQPLPERLSQIRTDLETFLHQHSDIAAAGVEELFFAKNITTAASVFQARGVILETLQRAGIPRILDVKPQQLKQYTTGHGNATKAEMGILVKQTFQLDAIPQPDDAADAAAITIATEALIRAQ